MIKDKIGKKSKRVVVFVLLLSVCMISMSSLFAYYTNIHKFFNDNRQSDGQGGFGQERQQEEFIVDGCGIDTMLDTLTGLCWDKNFNHNGATLQWAIDVSYREPKWNKTTKAYDYPVGRTVDDYPAFKYCEELVLGSHNDWRLPSRNELMTLASEAGPSGHSCSNLHSFGFSNCVGIHLTQTEWNQASFEKAMGIDTNSFSDAENCAKNHFFYVVCVRKDY